MSWIINVINAVTNLYGVRAMLLPVMTPLGKFLTLLAIITSIFNHLGEVNKHGLPGIYPFNLHLNLYLNLDRIAAISLMVHTILTRNIVDTILHTPYPYIALLSLILSDTIRPKKPHPYLFFHTIWHILAFHCLYLTYA